MNITNNIHIINGFYDVSAVIDSIENVYVYFENPDYVSNFFDDVVNNNEKMCERLFYEHSLLEYEYHETNLIGANEKQIKYFEETAHNAFYNMDNTETLQSLYEYHDRTIRPH